MNLELLKKHINKYKQNIDSDKEKFSDAIEERKEIVLFYQGFDKERISSFNNEDIYEYMSGLWAMLLWGNKQAYIDKVINDNTLDKLRINLTNLIWGSDDIIAKWETFRKNIKWIGPAMMSELLCKTFPEKYIIWNRRAFVALQYLGIENLPKYDYQVTGNKYKEICQFYVEISDEMRKAQIENSDMFSLDYFIWEELQVERFLSRMHDDHTVNQELNNENDDAVFEHNEIRDKIQSIGKWLGFNAETEQLIAKGAKVDTIWEVTIGNMGRVIYVFEVQKGGSPDSLILNFLKALNNPAVQSIVAVSDSKQLESIKNEVEAIPQLKEKLRYWDIENVMEVYDCLEITNSSINRLQLVPDSFSKGSQL